LKVILAEATTARHGSSLHAVATHRPLLQRQCACGGSSGLTGSCSNCAKKKLLGQPLQAKLRITEAGDGYEREADCVAEQVMRLAEPGQAKDRSNTATVPLVQRKVNGSSGAIGTVPSIVQDVLASPGQPLDGATRAFFEPRFGQDFSRVRIHSDAQAEQSAHALGALAFTVGQHIVFGLDRYAPNSVSGKKLLAHEFSHVAQQSLLAANAVVQRASSGEPAAADPALPPSLAPEIAAIHEIVIDGEPFDLKVITSATPLESLHESVQQIVKAYLGDYPNLGSGLWAFIMRQQDGVFCNIGGNCLGWALATFGTIDPGEHVWTMVPQYLESIGARTRGTALETYKKRVHTSKTPPQAIWDYFMSVTFDAAPTNSEGEAHLAFYGRGFANSMDGPSHIAFRSAGGEFWVSKPSATRFPVIHQQSAQMSGGQMGDQVRLYKRQSGPLNHVIVRSKQVGEHE
jgi:hypothetical protein